MYLEELRGEVALYPTWLPIDPMELGAFGTLQRGRFVTDGRLADLGIEVVTSASEQTQPIKFQRGMKVGSAVSASAKAEHLDAGMGISFEATRAYAWAFVARGMSKVEIRNIHEVQREVLEAQRRGDWRREWLLVSELRCVELLNVLVARGNLVKATVRGKGTVAEPLDVLLQADAKFELSGDGFFSVQNARSVTPLYGLRKLRGRWDPQLGPISRGTRGHVDGDADALEIANNEPLFRKPPEPAMVS